MDREVVLEALSALTGLHVKPHTTNASVRSVNSLNSDAQLDIYNLISTALLRQNVPTTKAAVECDSEYTDLGKEVFVNMDEFFDPGFDYDFTHLKDTSVCM